ncbi:centromere kinetochore component CENP-T-domain-containing protein [Rhexocercosporidium sp. MPI-PUGE-AT-0058]|nr:centromere kinetochore component CENP-T-domain-containing protein [Rhexocercosporidium sp. MPI-PUGE-AT-0058]
MSTRRASRERQALNPASTQNNEGNTSGQPRITPRNSDGDEARAAAAAKETPWRTLNQLANIPKPTTPLRRASSAGPPSTRRSSRRTPAGQARTPGAATRLNNSARRPIVVTPHGRAARRELDFRRGLTPGKDRRKSGLQQRETPRDILRQLSRVLAPKTQPTAPTPQGQDVATSRRPGADEDDLEDGRALDRPRFSLPMGDYDEDDEDDSLLLPPRSAGLEDENFTVQSVELPRRAVSELPPGRLSRGSFGSVRMSDVFADLNDMGINGGDVYDSSYLAERTFGDLDFPVGEDAGVDGENTETLRDITLGGGRLSMASRRESDIRPATISADDTETTFVFNVQPREVSEEPIFDDGQEGGPEEEELDEDPESEVELEQRDGIEAEDQEESLLEVPGDISMADTTIQDTTMQDIEGVNKAQGKVVKKKKVKLSKHGIEYPSLPVGVVKKLATTFARTSGNSKAKINKETLEAVMQASDWFFEQVSGDLGAYAKHAGRKTIEESDILAVMAR